MNIIKNKTMLNKTIKNLRINNNISQGKFANILGISQAFLSQIEKGDRKAKNEILQKIADYFNIPISYLHLQKIRKHVEHDILFKKILEIIDNMVNKK